MQSFSSDYIKACNGIDNARDGMNLQQVLKMRSENNFMYYDFINYFVSAVVGKMNYKKKSCNLVLSKYATVSDEAFALLSLENNFDTWIDMGLTGNSKTSKVPRKYTNGGNSLGKVATSQHNKGWSNEGLHRFNELFGLVEMNRAAPVAKQFEEDFRKWCKVKALGKQKKVKKVFTEAVQVCHELWSDHDDEEFTNVEINDGSEYKRLKTDAQNKNSLFNLSNQLENELIATPSGYDDDDDESEEDLAAPIPDKSVFYEV